ncbi:hypothetical protein L1S35_02590 [Flavobacterium sp. AS60]|uniref:hypothetical protein n=1 Tax=Flavobacterium anseongense TaxID=2910677 RepID=UPI001F42BF1A|nr:hypothetical protein [Flavobacterium sp. AS60]MCF6128543.1 hypothetical protein [Flavobacterium sp. AS60]
MKKRLEAELISIAHRILKLKNKSEVDQLYKETQKLYETLSVLKFYQDNFESVKSEVSEEVLEEKLSNQAPIEQVAEAKDEVIEPIAEVATEAEAEEEDTSESELAEQIISEEPEAVLEEEEVLEEVAVDEPEAISVEPAFKPIFELEAEEDEEPVAAEVASEVQPEEKLEDLIGNYADPVFVKPNEVSLFPSETPLEEVKQEVKEEPKTAAFNEMTSKSIAIGLNDRIGFVQHLFNDSNEDFNRVISQLNTFDTFEEAKNFINEMVIPDYNYWVGEEDYIERFMEIVEKKFQ